MEQWKKNAVQLLCGWMLEEKEDPSVIEKRVQKTSIGDGVPTVFPQAKPEAVGVSPDRLCDMLQALEAEPRAHLHVLCVYRDGKEILHVCHPGYDADTRYLSHSMAKSVTGLAVCLAIEDGVLTIDAPVLDFFPDLSDFDGKADGMTVYDLLTMSSGSSFAEAGAVTSDDYLTSFFTSEFTFLPGSAYAYNSMNSYLLARIVEIAEKKPFLSFVEERLFSPLGIRDWLWETDKDGHAKGGFGLYLSAHSWAKLGLTVAAGGVYDGKRLLSSDVLKKATRICRMPPNGTGDFAYAYHMWVGKEKNEVLFNGMLGQNVWISEDRRTVAVLLSGNNEIFQQSPALTIVRSYLSAPDDADGVTAQSKKRLAEEEKHFFEGRHWIRYQKNGHPWLTRLHLSPKEPWNPQWTAFLGEYDFPDNHEELLPLFVRVMQNNYNGGVRRMSLLREGDGLVLLWETTAGESHRLPLGLYGVKETALTFGGEPYLVRASAEVLEDIDRRPVAKIELIFPELPNVRMIKLSLPEKNRLAVQFGEVPDDRLTQTLIGSVRSGKFAFLFDVAEKKLGEGFLLRTVHNAFAPLLFATRAEAEDAALFIKEENLARQARIHKRAWLRPWLDRFLGVGETNDEREAKAGGILSLIGSLWGRKPKDVSDWIQTEPQNSTIEEEDALSAPEAETPSPLTEEAPEREETNEENV